MRILNLRYQDIYRQDRLRWHHLLSLRLSAVRNVRLSLAAQQADQEYVDLLVAEVTRQCTSSTARIAELRDLVTPVGPSGPAASRPPSKARSSDLVNDDAHLLQVNQPTHASPSGAEYYRRRQRPRPRAKSASQTGNGLNGDERLRVRRTAMLP
eukprot:3347216-Pyramimonas_sp.AAC.1